MRFLCAALGAAFFATGALAANDIGDKPEWYACEKDADCVAEESIYGGLIGVNKRHHKSYQDWLQEKNYERVGEVPKNLKAVCVSGLCTEK